MTGTTSRKNNIYNTGLGDTSSVAGSIFVWKSKDLVEWESLGERYSLKDGYWANAKPELFKQESASWRLWAPELYFMNNQWVIVHTSPSPVEGANLSLTRGRELQGPYDNPMGKEIGKRHDPSLFKDEDGTVYLLWSNTMIAPLKKKFKGVAGNAVRIDPSGSRPGPLGKPISHIGHEGATIRKIGDKYVHFGTAWSTDKMRKGTYNLYYCTADKVTGPYGPRKFVGRFLGHGTPFQDKQGRWWCTAFYNSDVPPLSRQQIKTKDMSGNAYTINEQGVTIVPLEVRTLESGELFIRAKDPDYAVPGKEEVQKFEF